MWISVHCADIHKVVRVAGELVHEFPSNMAVSFMGESLSVLEYSKRLFTKQSTVRVIWKSLEWWSLGLNNMRLIEHQSKKF